MHARNALNPGLAVRIDEAGLLVTGLSEQVILWQEITSLLCTDVFGTKFLVFEMTEERSKNFKRFQSFMAVLNRPFYNGGFSLPTNNITSSHSKVIAAIREFAPPQLCRHLPSV